MSPSQSTTHPPNAEWLAREWEALTSERVILRPSDWAEQKRYLPASVTALPGYFRFSVAPYLREIVDCLGLDSPVREVSVMKGVQLCVTTGILENTIGWLIEHVRTSPAMLLTADQELAKLRMDSHITPMLQESGLAHLITSADQISTRKTGKTDQKIEWFGGGFLIPFGAKSANKLRSIPIEYLLRDEIDGYPDIVGRDGDPMKLSADRTAAFEGTRKIADVSTPTIKGQSKIEARFETGDQRYYFVRCLKCNFPQILRWRHDNKDTGERTGIVWETDRGRLVADSVRYLCQECGHPHANDDKTRLLAPEHGAKWRPTTAAADPSHRSYHLSALYSPVGMQTWAACVRKWLGAWDAELNRPRDMGRLQVFCNNVLGEPFELRGEKVRFETVSEHRRSAYRFGQIPNAWAAKNCGGHAVLLTCAVDVHKDGLAVAVFAWCRGRRALLIDYWRLEGETERLDNLATWGRLHDIIDSEYTADDGKRYRIALTLIDSGYRADDVYTFAGEYSSGVYPVKGRDAPPKAARLLEFSEFKTPMGTRAYAVTVDVYKDRWSSALRHEWDGLSMQPAGHFNAPQDATDKQLRELTVETKREKIERATGKRVGFEWHRPSGAANELWDLLIYNSAALDLIAWSLCVEELKAPKVVWNDFFDLAEERALFFAP